MLTNENRATPSISKVEMLTVNFNFYINQNSTKSSML